MGGDNVKLSAGANPGQRIRVRCASRIVMGRGEIVSARKGGDNVRWSAGENPGQMRDLHLDGARGKREQCARRRGARGEMLLPWPHPMGPTVTVTAQGDAPRAHHPAVWPQQQPWPVTSTPRPQLAPRGDTKEQRRRMHPGTAVNRPPRQP